MARPREYNPDTVLDSAIEVFWRKGYKATSIQDLVDATGVNRGSLYTGFGSKAGLFSAALDRYLAAGALADLLNSGDDTPIVDLLRMVFDELVEIGVNDPDRRGCLMTNTAVELSPHDTEVAAKIAGDVFNLETALANRLRRAQGLGELNLAADNEALARFIISNIQGMRVMAKVTNDRRTLQDIADMVVETVRSYG